MMMDPSYIVCFWSRNHCIVANPLSNTMKIFVEFTEHAYGRLGESLRGVTEDELCWHPVPEMNTAGKILRHSARISYVLLPQVVRAQQRGTGTTTTSSGSTPYPRCSATSKRAGFVSSKA